MVTASMIVNLLLFEGKKENKRKQLHAKYRRGVYADYSGGQPVYSCQCPVPGCHRIHGHFRSRQEAFRNRECEYHRLKTFEKLKKQVEKALKPVPKKETAHGD